MNPRPVCPVKIATLWAPVPSGFGTVGAGGSSSAGVPGGSGFGAGRAMLEASGNLKSKSERELGVSIGFLAFVGPYPVLVTGGSQDRRNGHWSGVAANLRAALQTDVRPLGARRFAPPDQRKDDYGCPPACGAARANHHGGSGNFGGRLGTVASWRQSLHLAPREKDRGASGGR
jgi:hypothetical protein